MVVRRVSWCVLGGWLCLSRGGSWGSRVQRLRAPDISVGSVVLFIASRMLGHMLGGSSWSLTDALRSKTYQEPIAIKRVWNSFQQCPGWLASLSNRRRDTRGSLARAWTGKHKTLLRHAKRAEKYSKAIGLQHNSHHPGGTETSGSSWGLMQLLCQSSHLPHQAW